MHKIFSYTIPNTGTRFMNNIFREGVEALAFIGDLHVRQRGRENKPLDQLPCKGICEEWWKPNVLSYAKDEELSKTVLFHTHHGNLESEIIAALRNTKPDTKTISSIRDPLLVINTAIWTNYSLRGIHISTESKEKREERAHYIASLFDNIFSIPQEHIFLFPTDLIQTKTPEEKLSSVKELITYCDLSITEKIRKLALGWDVVGDTGKTKRLKAKKRGREFALYKRTIQSKDIKEINKILSIEIACLNKHKTLKLNLENLGYNICW